MAFKLGRGPVHNESAQSAKGVYDSLGVGSTYTQL